MTITAQKTLHFKNIHSCFEVLAQNLGAILIDYTAETSILSINLPDGRRQNVRGFLRERSHHPCLVLMSKVCATENVELDYKALFEEMNHLKFSKFVIHHDYLEVKANALLENVPLDYLQEIVMEVAQTADAAEHRLTGEDAH